MAAAVNEATRVKYRAVVMNGAILLEIRVPLEATALTSSQATRLNAGFSRATELVRETRDELADELRSRGICPWCNELRGPEGHNPECHGAG